MLGRFAQHSAFTAMKTLILSMFLLLACACSGLAYSQDIAPQIAHVAEEITKTTSASKTLAAELKPEFSVVLEGKTIAAEVSKDGNGGVYVRAEPIFKALNDHFEFNFEEGVLIVKRSQDGVVMELYTETGIVKANGRALGKLKNFGEISAGKINLTPNAITVLSGAIGKINEKENQINFDLDPRLKVATGFEVFVNDIPLGHLNPPPKSIGSVMLMPLRPIAKELGHEVTVIDGGASIRVRRAQDSAVFELNLDTGLVKLNGRPQGVTRDITYIDGTNLLLPISAIEVLTGTHVDVEAGSARINVTLDDRLTGAIKPGARVDEKVKNEPFTLETIKFHAGTDTINTLESSFRVKGLNGRLRYEIPDLPSSASEAEPSWLSLDYAHVKGGYGSLGDYAADLRELDGVGILRIRGASFAKENDKGRWALAAGMPVSGSARVSEDQSRLTYGGLAAGVRYASKDGWEAGLALKSDAVSDDQMAVLSAISGRLGRNPEKKVNWDARADIGAFKGPAREKSLDARASVNARYEINENINVDGFVSYDGAEFLRSDLDAKAQQEALNPDADPSDEENQLAPDLRARGKDFITYGAAVQVAARKDFGPLVRPAASVRYSKNQSGVFAGADTKTSVDNYGIAVNTQIKKTNTSLSMDFSGFTQTLEDGSQKNGDQFTARAYQDTKYAGLRVQYSAVRLGDAPRKQRVDAQLSAKPIVKGLPKAAKISIAPSIAASWSDDGEYMRGGVIANFNGGDLLGKKTEFQASLGVLQNFSGDAKDKSDTFLTVSLGRKLKINKNLALGVSYRNDLRGEQRVGIFLDGRFGFNEKRNYSTTQDGRGVLKGRAFFDKNRDGIRQEDEPGIGGALVRIKGTRMSLRTDNAGYFTIQNIKQGLHEVQVDGRSLPLGFTLMDGFSTRATITEGHITDVPLPIVQRGQVRGFVYIDANVDGEHNKGETRIEGAKLSLTKH